ncbi:MAG: exo-alpha-sialidase [Candidatus Methanofastidiosa archaeon]|nr:exo-alpha-sialidase [Candidatus Methanofastidiosa archaeon]
MKNILITIQFLLIFFTTTFSQVSYWEKVDSLLFARTHKIECGDSLNCIAMFIVTHPVPTLDSCLLGKVSTNGGKTWTKNFHDCYRAIQYDNCSYYWHKPEKFFFLSFPSRNRAFALLDNGKVMYSDDNGKIWKRVIIDSSLLYLFRYANKGFAMRDDSLGIVFAYYSKDSISLPKSHLYFTSNAGYNWVELIPNSEEFKQMNIFRISFPAQNVAKFIAFDSLESNYKLVSYSIISNNCSFKPIPIAKSSAIAPCIYFQNENNGWIVGIDYNQELNKFYDVIYFTSDGGESWINQ